MLIASDDQTNPTLVGLDPGTVNVGVCILEINPISLELIKTSSFSINGNKLGPNEWTALTHGERIARIRALGHKLLKIFRKENPILIATESPFFNPRRPNAFSALVEILYEIRNALIRYSPYNTLYLIDPPNVKMAVKAGGGADKEDVKTSLSKIQEITDTLDCKFDDLDEHAIDATAVAYCLLVKLRQNKLSSLKT